MAYRDTLVRLAKMLMPDGEAFKIPTSGNFEKLQRATMSDSIGGVGHLQAAIKQISYDILPDNPNFDIATARLWYSRLGLYDSGDVSLADMKAAIKQKMSWAVTPLRKQNYLYIEEQLRLAGFDIRVYPNRFWDGSTWITKTPGEILGTYAGDALLDGFGLDDIELDGTWADDGISLCMNYLEEAKDADFFISEDGWMSTFYIAGATVDAFADVPEGRKTEFRQLILKLKAAQMCAVLFVNYV